MFLGIGRSASIAMPTLSQWQGAKGFRPDPFCSCGNQRNAARPHGRQRRVSLPALHWTLWKLSESETCFSPPIMSNGRFGAMLRSMGKAAGKKTTNFGACRDLNGRRLASAQFWLLSRRLTLNSVRLVWDWFVRLRHVNNEIRLQKWLEQKEEREKAKREGIDLADL